MDTNAIQDAAFRVHNAISHAQFHALLAYKYGQADTLEQLRGYLADAIATIDAATKQDDVA